MAISYKTACGQEQIIEFCKIAKTNRLFIPGWNLICDLNGVVDGRINAKKIEISLAYDGEKPIAIAFKINKTIQCFVRLAYRRKGIGSQVIKPHVIEKLRTLSGTRHSKAFWHKNCVI
jgi:GNAT superfamily N-acetyltransferase